MNPSLVLEDEPLATTLSPEPAQPDNPRKRPHDRLIWMIASRFGARSKEVERFIKFAVVGAIGTVVDFGTLNILQQTLLHPHGPNETLHVALSSGIAFTAAVASNFIWNRYWTYPDSRSRHVGLQLMQFFIINTIAVGFRLVFVSLTYAPLGAFGERLLGHPDVEERIANQLGTNIAQAMAIGVALFWNFFMNRYWTYSDVDKGHTPPNQVVETPRVESGSLSTD